MEFLSYGVDLLIVLVLGIVTYFGYKDGFIKTFVSLLSYAISIAVAFLLSAILANVITELSRQWFIDSMQTQLAGLTVEQIGDNLTRIIESFPVFLQSFAENILESQQDMISQNAELVQYDIATTVADTILLPMFNLFIRTIVFIILFLILRIGLNIIVRQLNIINHIPFIGGANRFLGLVLGLVYALGIVVVIVNAVDLLLAFTSAPLGDGFLYPLLSEINPLSLMKEFDIAST